MKAKCTLKTVGHRCISSFWRVVAGIQSSRAAEQQLVQLQHRFESMIGSSIFLSNCYPYLPRSFPLLSIMIELLAASSAADGDIGERGRSARNKLLLMRTSCCMGHRILMNWQKQKSQAHRFKRDFYCSTSMLRGQKKLTC